MLVGQGVVINGLAEAFKGKKITLYVKRDFLSDKTEKVTSTIVSEDDGKFVFPIDIDSIGMFLLKVNGITGSFYLRPNNTYDLIFPDLPPGDARTINGTQTVDVLFPDLDSTDINFLLSEFNMLYENQFYGNIRLLQSKMFLPLIDSFKLDMDKRYGGLNNYFFKTYREYAIGSAELLKYDAGGGRRKLDIFNEYLRNRPILYSNQEYVRFVSSFFRGFIFSFNHTKESGDVFYAINHAHSPTLLSEVFKTNDFLKDKELREFIILQSMASVFGKKGFDEEGVLAIIDSIASKSIYKNNALLARNLKAELTYLSVGYPAPDFTFTDKKGELKSLSDLKGQYVYLNFWASWCKDCVAEMGALPVMYKRYKKDIEIISVCIDEKPDQMQSVLDKNKDFKWEFVHSPVFSELFNAYDVRTVPSYYLIDDEGNILQHPAYTPTPNGTGQTIEETFNSIYKKLHPRKKGWTVGGKN